MPALPPASQSWGRLRYAPPAVIRALRSRSAALPGDRSVSWLPYGNGRSYGDCCINSGQGILDCRRLDKFVAWDAQSGELTCEAGVRLDTILRFATPRGWFLPVTPGTQYVTLGGAIANDVHGKNHHAAGSLGNHVKALTLLRPEGIRSVGAEQDVELFKATIGGLGLTGVITHATLQMKRAPGEWLMCTTRRFRSVAEFFDIDEELRPKHEYTVAWIDCLAPTRERGRGLYSAGNHAAIDPPFTPKGRKVTVPFELPGSLVRPLSLRAFNAVYYHRSVAADAQPVHYRPFFYPLDAVLEWNRIYGPRGFFQFQCVIPPAASRRATELLIDIIARRGEGSFLAVLKTFGSLPSRGLLSFPRPGTTLALDFPNRGDSTRALLSELEAIAIDAGGALYAAKDAVMSPASFRASYPRWTEMLPHVALGFSSAFWRRVTGGAPG